MLPCCCVYLQTKQGKKARSTVAEEIVDNLSLMIQDHKDLTAEYPYLVMDNAAIQSCITGPEIESRQGNQPFPESHRDKLPPHSPDLNQTAEQSVGAVKGDVIGQMADHVQMSVGAQCSITPEMLWRMGKKAMENFRHGLLFPGGVERSVHRMPEVWAVVAAEVDEEICIGGGRPVHGTAGDWAPVVLR